MREFWQFRQPGLLSRFLFVLGFLAVEAYHAVGVTNGGAIGAGVEIAAAVTCITERRGWYALMCALGAYVGLTDEPGAWAARPAAAHVAGIVLLVMMGGVLVLIALQALGIVKPRAVTGRSQPASD